MLCDFAGSVSSAACPGQGPGTAGTLQHRRGRCACSFLRGQLGSAWVGGREGCGWVPCSWQGCMLMPFSPAHRAPLWDSTALGGCGLSALVASAAWASLSSHVVRCHRDPEGRGNWRRAAELFWGPSRHLALVPAGSLLCILALQGERNVLCPKNPVWSGSIYKRPFANQQKSRGKSRSVRRRLRFSSARKTRIQMHLECCKHCATLHRAGGMELSVLLTEPRWGSAQVGGGEVRQD